MSDSYEPLYYAKDGEIRKRSVVKNNPDGSQSMSFDFPIATMHQAVGDDAADAVAGLMNAGERADEAERLLRKIAEAKLKGPHTSAKDGFSAALLLLDDIRLKASAFLDRSKP